MRSNESFFTVTVIASIYARAIEVDRGALRWKAISTSQLAKAMVAEGILFDKDPLGSGSPSTGDIAIIIVSMF